MKNYRLMFGLFLLFAALTAVIFAYGYDSITRKTTVAVALEDIMPNQAASPANVGSARFPIGGIQVDTVLRPVELKGMAARGYIPKGTILRKSMFQPVEEAGASAILSLKKGLVAIALPPSIDTTCGGQVKQGCLVDVKIVGQDGSIITIPGVEVLAADQTKGVVIGIDQTSADTILRLRNRTQIVLQLVAPSAVQERGGTE